MNTSTELDQWVRYIHSLSREEKQVFLVELEAAMRKVGWLAQAEPPKEVAPVQHPAISIAAAPSEVVQVTLENPQPFPIVPQEDVELPLSTQTEVAPAPQATPEVTNAAEASAPLHQQIQIKKSSGAFRRGLRKFFRVGLLSALMLGANTSPLQNTELASTSGQVTMVAGAKLHKSKAHDALAIIGQSAYEHFSLGAKQAYIYGLSNIQGSYIIVDKPTATGYVIGENKAIITSFPVILGRAKGEAPNTSILDDLTTLDRTTTPAGRYAIGRDSTDATDWKEYDGNVRSIYGSGSLAIHETLPSEFAKRTAALNTPTPDDNRMSWGCVNVDKKIFVKYIRDLPENTTIFITPDS